MRSTYMVSVGSEAMMSDNCCALMESRVPRPNDLDGHFREHRYRKVAARQVLLQ